MSFVETRSKFDDQFMAPAGWVPVRNAQDLRADTPLHFESIADSEAVSPGPSLVENAEAQIIRELLGLQPQTVNDVGELMEPMESDGKYSSEELNGVFKYLDSTIVSWKKQKRQLLAAPDLEVYDPSLKMTEAEKLQQVLENRLLAFEPYVKGETVQILKEIFAKSPQNLEEAVSIIEAIRVSDRHSKMELLIVSDFLTQGISDWKQEKKEADAVCALTPCQLPLELSIFTEARMLQKLMKDMIRDLCSVDEQIAKVGILAASEEREDELRRDLIIKRMVQHEEPYWTDLGRAAAENEIKMQVADSIFDDLIRDTTRWLEGIGKSKEVVKERVTETLPKPREVLDVSTASPEDEKSKGTGTALHQDAVRLLEIAEYVHRKPISRHIAALAKKHQQNMDAFATKCSFRQIFFNVYQIYSRQTGKTPSEPKFGRHAFYRQNSKDVSQEIRSQAVYLAAVKQIGLVFEASQQAKIPLELFNQLPKTTRDQVFGHTYVFAKRCGIKLKGLKSGQELFMDAKRLSNERRATIIKSYVESKVGVNKSSK
ncbi:MAG: hypothetical protein KGZ39_08270 [Simkania sp.]|nr:hypothetical protein [Simkania sp.]